jgi:A118 family predicted phage portal protein
MFFDARSKFPGNEHDFYFNKIQEWATWYSGDPNELIKFYAINALNIFDDVSSPQSFWKRINEESSDRDGIVHLPAAGDIASTSSDLLFSESPRIKYDENNESGKRIKLFLENNGFNNILLEGAELSAALSGCILKLDIDPELEKIPLVSIIAPLQFFATFWRGRLWEVLFYRVVKTQDNGVIYRLFENRKRVNRSLVIDYQLCKGTVDKVGQEVSPQSIKETQNMNLESVIYNNVDGLGCVYVPNKKPNKLLIGSPLGINDYSGCISLLDSLDFAWTSWMRDIELGMAQIFVDEELLSKSKNDITGELNYLNKFNKLTKSFMKMNLTNWRMGGETGVKPIEFMQFDIRVDSHQKTTQELLINIINSCGYSPQTFGLGDYGRAESGTALKIREHKSQTTREKKANYWIPEIKRLLLQMQQLDISSELSFSYDIQDDIAIEIEDSITTDSKENSEIIKNLDQAKAISNYQKVKLQHPDWDENKVLEEVENINKEQGITSELIHDEV